MDFAFYRNDNPVYKLIGKSCWPSKVTDAMSKKCSPASNIYLYKSVKVADQSDTEMPVWEAGKYYWLQREFCWGDSNFSGSQKIPSQCWHFTPKVTEPFGWYIECASGMGYTV